MSDPISDLAAALAMLPRKPDLVGISSAEPPSAPLLDAYGVPVDLDRAPPDDGAEAIVRALAKADPNFRGHDVQHECALCGVLGATAPEGHKPSCPWAQARAWVAAHDVPEDIEPPSYDEPGGEPWQRGR